MILNNLQEKPNDEEIIERIIKQDSSLFSILIRRYNSYLYRIGKMYRFSHEDIEDLMQESYLEIYAHLKNFEGKSSFKTWISKIMFRKCYHRYKKLGANLLDRISENQDALNSYEDHSASKKMISTEMKEVIEKALLQIPLDYRSVFILREINGLNVIETAQVLEISENSVKTRLHRAKRLLRTEIKKFYSKEDIFEFNLIYCDAMVQRVMSQIYLF